MFMTLEARCHDAQFLSRGMGVTVALPYPRSHGAALQSVRASCAVIGGRRQDALRPAIEMVHGAAGSAPRSGDQSQQPLGARRPWGRGFDAQSPRARSQPLEPLAQLSDHHQQHRRASMAEAFDASGNRWRSLPLERGVPHAAAPQADAGFGPPTSAPRSISYIRAGSSDQDTAIPSMQFCIENVDAAGGCSYGYSCVYTDTISWASPGDPMPMIRDPRVAFDQLFGVGATPQARAERRAEDKSILDWITADISRLKRQLGASTRPGSATTSTTSAKSSGASRRPSRSTAAAKSGRCPARRSACPTRSKSTSS